MVESTWIEDDEVIVNEQVYLKLLINNKKLKSSIEELKKLLIKRNFKITIKDVDELFRWVK